MRKLYVLTAFVIVGGLPVSSPAADVTSYGAWQAADGWDDQAVGCDTTAQYGYGECLCSQRPSCCHSCGPCCGCSRCGMRQPRRSRTARIGDFNCGCRGSYNFPVPPQYTYHWPGLYAQQSMTEYTSPWRFPGLKPYEDESVELERGAGKLARLKPSAKAAGSGDSESISLKIKRHFGVQ